jgi:hypothetical protein
MTPDERLDRLERITKLIVRAGLRERKDTREKIDALINAHIQTEEALTKLAQSQAQLAEAQAHTDRRLDALIDIIREGRNGKS